MGTPESSSSPSSPEKPSISVRVGTTPNTQGIYPAFSEYRLPIILDGETHYCEVLGYNPTNETLVVRLYDAHNKALRNDEFPLAVLQKHCPFALTHARNLSVHTQALIQSNGAPAIALSVTLTLWALLTSAPHAQLHEKAPRVEGASSPITIESPTEVTMKKGKKLPQD